MFKKYDILTLVQVCFILFVLFLWSIFHNGNVAEFFWTRFIRIPASKASHFYLVGIFIGCLQSLIVFLFFFFKQGDKIKTSQEEIKNSPAIEQKKKSKK